MIGKLYRWLRSRLALRGLSAARRAAAEWAWKVEESRLALNRRTKELEEVEQEFASFGDRLWDELNRLSREEFDRRMRKLDALRRRFTLTAASTLEDLEEAEVLQRQSEQVVEALRNENDVLGKVAIPTLTAMHKLILERVDAETALQIGRRVALAAEEREPG